jgi:hypothetical protein
MKRKILILLLWLSLCAIFAVAGYLIIKPSSSYDLAERGISIQGYVTAKESENHRIIRYSYRVGDKYYQGIGHGGAGNPSFDELNIGSFVFVVYDPTNPNISTMGQPKHHWRVNLTGIFFLAIVGPLIVMFSLYISW